MSTYLILKRGGHAVDHDESQAVSQAVWFELGEVEAGYPEKALQQVAAYHGEGDYLALSPLSRELFTVSSRKEYDIERTSIEVAA